MEKMKINNLGRSSQHVTEKEYLYFTNYIGKTPTYITNYYPPENQIYRTLGLWQNLFLIAFLPLFLPVGSIRSHF